MSPEYQSSPNNPWLQRAQEISQDHFTEARRVTAATPLDYQDAELVLRCPAVFTDRLTPEEFEMLDGSIQNGFKNLATIVQEQLGVRPGDPERHAGETMSQYDYRINVWSVIHGLQQMVLFGPDIARGGYDPDKEGLVREAVFLASHLFSQALPDAVSQGFPEIIRTLNYFREKTKSVEGTPRHHRS